ncbi:MAG: hypothetical protein ACLSB9_17895 [Hydrogeniiclostridium mannosilyticum]
MDQSKYRIFELSARAVMSYAAQENGQWHFALDRAATEKCKRVSALHEQDGNALFFQIMCRAGRRLFRADRRPAHRRIIRCDFLHGLLRDL